jgi:nucleoside 2-deoxyribosyltransferase
MAEIYVISPVGSDPVFPDKRRILEERARQLGLEALFPMDALRKKLDSASHIRQAMSQMVNAEIVIADLSLERPSCYFELGIAEAAGASVVLVARTGTDIHQTSSRDSVRWYADLDDYKELIRGILSGLERNFRGSSDPADN